VARFLSDEWLDAFDAALRADASVGPRFAASPIAIAQEVIAETGARVGYVVVLDGDGGRMERNDRAGDVTFVCNRATAAALARGELNAQRALTSGRLKLRGDVDRLGTAASALAALGDALAGLREATTY
jgi:putative sterol carrier protein